MTAALAIRQRIGTVPDLPAEFWTWVVLAALLHDPGKLATGFQRMVGNTPEPPQPWGERHEVLSLGFVRLLLDHLPADQRRWISAAVAAHHRPLTSEHAAGPKTPLVSLYWTDSPEAFADRFTPADQGQLDGLTAWLHATALAHGLPFAPAGPAITVPELIDAAHAEFRQCVTDWEPPLPFGSPDGLRAVLLLGAVTMADHLSSAHAGLETRHPLTLDYPERLAARLAATGHTLRPQQQVAAAVRGNLLLRSWTGSGKTEAAYLWALTQITDLAERTGGTPRLFYLLPYLASINAMADRTATELQSPAGIGVAHSKSASYHLARALDDGCPGGEDDEATAAQKAHSRAAATRNFRELVRIGTPYQLLRGALAGAVHAGILLDSANSVFVLDELHAYDPRRLGMILAMTRLWHRIGGRIAVISATLPDARWRWTSTWWSPVRTVPTRDRNASSTTFTVRSRVRTVPTRDRNRTSSLASLIFRGPHRPYEGSQPADVAAGGLQDLLSAPSLRGIATERPRFRRGLADPVRTVPTRDRNR